MEKMLGICHLTIVETTAVSLTSIAKIINGNISFVQIELMPDLGPDKGVTAD